jgi:Zn-dependent peptidase ImmA (M78 family)/transcriptional regulator with XRE-family HTH domain
MVRETGANLTMPGDLGRRLRIVRHEARLTQAEAAAVADIARTTLISIEQGNREVRIRELHILAGLYGVSVDDLICPQAVYVDIVPQCHRLLEYSDPAVEAAVHMLAGLAKAEAELENVLAVPHGTNYPPERPLFAGDVRLQAEEDAAGVREWLGLDPATAPDMSTLLAGELGVRVFVRPIAAHVRGIYVFDAEVGACTLVNGNMPLTDRRYIAARQLGSLMACRHEVDISLNRRETRVRASRYCDAFARAFLMPPRAVMRQFKDVARPGHGLTWQHVVRLAGAFGVSPKLLVRRLEDVRLVLPHSWARFEAHADSDEQQVLDQATVGLDAAAGPASERLNRLAAEAWRRDLMTEARIAGLFHLDRVGVREMLATTASEQSAAEDGLEVPA